MCLEHLCLRRTSNFKEVCSFALPSVVRSPSDDAIEKLCFVGHFSLFPFFIICQHFNQLEVKAGLGIFQVLFDPNTHA